MPTIQRANLPRPRGITCSNRPREPLPRGAYSLPCHRRNPLSCLETLREYVLVAQDRIRVEHYGREGEEWVLSEVSDSDTTLVLGSIDCHIGIAVIYEKVDFESSREG